MAATVAVPTLQSILVSGAAELPLGLSDVHGVVFGLSLVAGLLLSSAPLRDLLGGAHRADALARRVARRAGARRWPSASWTTRSRPTCPTSARSPQFGTTLVFVLIVLLWFYALAIIILGGAVVNAIRLNRERPPVAEGAGS